MDAWHGEQDPARQLWAASEGTSCCGRLETGDLTTPAGQIQESQPFLDFLRPNSNPSQASDEATVDAHAMQSKVCDSWKKLGSALN